MHEHLRPIWQSRSGRNQWRKPGSEKHQIILQAAPVLQWNQTAALGEWYKCWADGPASLRQGAL